ncbi:DinB family protein [Streptomyces sp. NPDC046374]|uniref:DinB family protein n=1 Tax=Streptomyces sp. NPDC046374 TaxID=3154917 RepID=UPI0034032D1D
MTLPDRRIQPPCTADERTTLTAMLDFQRDTLAMKCEGLTPEQLKERAVRPSGLSLLGLVRHAAEVERGWFRNVINGESSRSPWTPAGSTDWADFDIDDAADADVDEAFAVWREECRRARAIVEAADSLDVTGHIDEEAFSLRYVLAHMIEEYARHNGHADLLRERIDGVTGE